MAGRLAYKENRSDVTAQPYGINTTGAFITLGAINLQALLNEVNKETNINKGAVDGDWRKAGRDAAENAWKVAVTSCFVTGCMEVCGCFLGELIRKAFPSPAVYSGLTGAGYAYLFFAPMISIVAEPIMCYLPLLVVLVGFFGSNKRGVPDRNRNLRALTNGTSAQATASTASATRGSASR